MMKKKVPYKKPSGKKTSPGKQVEKKDNGDNSNLTRLNKYIANAGICSRREADKLIENGEIKVNGNVVTQQGTKVAPGDKVTFKGKVLVGEQLRYVLLNKPKGYITTSDDPHDRKTVLQLVEKACKERVYPVGRLDRNTTGLLLITNDGELTKRLTHPSHGVKKLYHVTLNKPISKNDILKVMAGLELEDGPIKPDLIERVADDTTKQQLGIELHSGKNRIVRRMFEHIGYEVVKLDRVMFAGLTKKDLPRGKWRMLDQKEISFLKMI